MANMSLRVSLVQAEHTSAQHNTVSHLFTVSSVCPNPISLGSSSFVVKVTKENIVWCKSFSNISWGD